MEKLYKQFSVAYTIAFILLLVLAMVTTAVFTAYWIWANKPVARVECINFAEMTI